MHNPDFDKLLNNGSNTYNGAIGDWWIQQTLDEAHQKAYHNISSFIHKFYQTSEKTLPNNIVDYACGSGSILPFLHHFFPKSKLLGLDGSHDLLKNFKEQHLKQTQILDEFVKKKQLTHFFNLQQTHLPNFSLPREKLDLCIWCFPNLIASEEFLDEYNDNGYQEEKNIAMADLLSRFREMDPEDEMTHQTQEDIFDELLSQRVIHLNIASLLKKGGIYAKVEYSNGKRKEMSKLTQLRSQFCEGTLQKKIKSLRVPKFFHEVKSTYFPSPVILDVFAQTQDPTDAVGGYTISLFKKI